MTAKPHRDITRRVATSSPATRSMTHHEHARLSAAGVSPSSLFTALDGLDLDVARHHWRIEVYSVADRARHRWIQLALRGSESLMLTLSLPTSDDVLRIVDALCSWLADPAHKPEMVHGSSSWT
jgi:hypothetical protein